MNQHDEMQHPDAPDVIPDTVAFLLPPSCVLVSLARAAWCRSIGNRRDVPSCAVGCRVPWVCGITDMPQVLDTFEN